MIDFVSVIIGDFEDRGYGSGFPAGHRSGKTGHLEGGDEDVALADGKVGGVSRSPWVSDTSQFPGFVGDQSSFGFEGNFNAGGFVEAKPSGFSGEIVDTGFDAKMVVKGVAAQGDGSFQFRVEVTSWVMAGEGASSYVFDSSALVVVDFFDLVIPHAGNSGENFEGGAGGVETLCGTIEPTAFCFDPAINFCRDVRGQVIQIVVRLAGHGQNFTGLHINGHDGGFFVFNLPFGQHLDVDINAGMNLFSKGGGFFFFQFELKAHGVDSPDFISGDSIQAVIKAAFKTGFPFFAVEAKGFQVFPSQFLGLFDFSKGDVAEAVGRGRMEGVVPSTVGINMNRGVERQLVDYPCIFFGSELLSKGKGEEEFLIKVSLKVTSFYRVFSACNEVNVIEVFPDDIHPRFPLKFTIVDAGFYQLVICKAGSEKFSKFVVILAILLVMLLGLSNFDNEVQQGGAFDQTVPDFPYFSDIFEILIPKFFSNLVQVDDGGVAGLIAHQQFAVPVKNFSSWCWQQYASLGL